MDWREHPRLTLTGLLLVIVVLVFLLARGCGCRWTRARAAAESAEAAESKTKTPTGKAKKVWTDDCPEPANWGREEESPKPAAPAKPPLAPQSGAATPAGAR